MGTIAKRIIVHGRVQGVFFRDGTRREAERQKVAGWVSNRDDGTVEVWAEGAPQAVDALVGWCREGPAGASVERVDVHDVEASGKERFDVR